MLQNDGADCSKMLLVQVWQDACRAAEHAWASLKCQGIWPSASRRVLKGAQIGCVAQHAWGYQGGRWRRGQISENHTGAGPLHPRSTEFMAPTQVRCHELCPYGCDHCNSRVHCQKGLSSLQPNSPQVQQTSVNGCHYLSVSVTCIRGQGDVMQQL